jgi:NAD(P)-dependent dehydrogenase (short-subunit alcohol dehydrogenase family)
MKRDLEEKVAIITGSAGGIGKALAEQLAERGCLLVLADVDEPLLQETASELRAAGATVEAKTVDVSDANQVKALIEGTFDEHGRIDYLFNNAAVNLMAELIDTPLDDWNRLVDVNLRGVFHGVHFGYPIMCEQGFGHIINTASVAGITPTPIEGAYSATKHGIIGLSSALRIEAAAAGVKVSVVCPGPVDTPMLKTMKHVKFGRDAASELAPERPVSPSRAAAAILRGVDRDRFFITVGKMTPIFWRVYRLTPAGFLSMGVLAMKKIRSIKLQAS